MPILSLAVDDSLFFGWSGWLRHARDVCDVFKCLIWISFLLIFINYAKVRVSGRSPHHKELKRVEAKTSNMIYVNEYTKTVDGDDTAMSNTEPAVTLSNFVLCAFFCLVLVAKPINSTLFFHDWIFFPHFVLKVRITRRMDDIRMVVLWSKEQKKSAIKERRRWKKKETV